MNNENCEESIKKEIGRVKANCLEASYKIAKRK